MSASGGSAPGPHRRGAYERVLRALATRWKRSQPGRGKMMQEIVDALWGAFGSGPYSWCGFYVPDAGAGALLLGPHRDKPACSPIGLHGVCGRAFLSRESQVVADVKTLGSAHIECDPANLSEIAVPVLDPAGKAFAVLDVDSRQLSAFGEEDRRWLERIVKSLGQEPPPV